MSRSVTVAVTDHFGSTIGAHERAEMGIRIDRSRPDHACVRFSLGESEHPGAVSVVGSFNAWMPGLDELQTQPDGARAVTVGVPYGLPLVFRYLGADGDWFDDPAADEVSDDGSLLYPIVAPTGGLDAPT